MQKQSHIKAMPRIVIGRLAAAAALFVGLTAGAIAADVSEKVAAQIKAGVNANTNGAVRVEQINTTPLTNIYEVISELMGAPLTGIWCSLACSLASATASE